MTKNEIYEELHGIYSYMDKRGAEIGYGQVKDLIDRIEEDALSEKPHFSLVAYLDEGWSISICDKDGDLVKQLDWSDFGFGKDEIFTKDEMEDMGFIVA